MTEAQVSAEEQKILNFRVRGEDPVQAVSALYSNFLAISRVGTDVQFEFIFLDLNLVAGILEQLKKAEKPSVPELQGKTVAKVVMPAATFFQLREHFENIFRALEEVVPKMPEAQDDRSSNVG
jgi:hypothetical protein